MTPLWRLPFDAIERPVAAFSESWARSDSFRDAVALTALVGGEDATELRLKSGHVGVATVGRAPKVAHPQIADWIRPTKQQT